MTTQASPFAEPSTRSASSSSPSRAALLAHAHASPAAVAARDKAAWLGLFADGGAVHDPVGTPPCHKGAHTVVPGGGQDDLARFYDCFIAPNAIRFESHRDLVCGRSVVRDVTLHVTGRAGVPTAVPAHLVYTMAEGGGALRIAKMEAYWQSADVMRTVRRAGARGAFATLLNVWHLGRSFGVAGTRAYLRGVQDRARSKPARDAVGEWFAAIDSAEGKRATELSAADVRIELPGGVRRTIADALANELRGVRVEAGTVLVCGWSASCSLRLRSSEGERAWHAVAIVDFARPTTKVANVRLYWDDTRAD